MIESIEKLNEMCEGKYGKAVSLLLEDVKKELWEDKEFIFSSLKLVGSDVFRFIDKKLIDRKFMLELLKQDICCYGCISKELCDDELFWYSFAGLNLKTNRQPRITLDSMMQKASKRLKEDEKFNTIMKIRCENHVSDVNDIKDVCLVFANDDRFKGMFNDIDVNVPLLFEPVGHKYFRELISEREVVFHESENIHELTDEGKLLFKKMVLEDKEVQNIIKERFNGNIPINLKPKSAGADEQDIAEVENFIKTKKLV